jgi:hypothetical protein
MKFSFGAAITVSERVSEIVENRIRSVEVGRDSSKPNSRFEQVRYRKRKARLPINNETTFDIRLMCVSRYMN